MSLYRYNQNSRGAVAIGNATHGVPRARRRTCALDGCTTAIPVPYLMCPKHWAQVPNHLQRAVLAGVRALRAADSLPDQKAAVAGYKAARQAALDSITQT